MSSNLQKNYVVSFFLELLIQYPYKNLDCFEDYFEPVMCQKVRTKEMYISIS